jgi:hypothetical protein
MTEKRTMKRIECKGMIGKFPTPQGMQTMYDTGQSLSPVDLAEALALQHSVFNATGALQDKAIQRLRDFMTEVVNKVNVYPVGYAGLSDDGRILVTEPWYEAKEKIS